MNKDKGVHGSLCVILWFINCKTVLPKLGCRGPLNQTNSDTIHSIKIDFWTTSAGKKSTKLAWKCQNKTLGSTALRCSDEG